MFCVKGFNADHTLSSKQSADIIAYVSMLEEKLSPALVNLFKCQIISLLYFIPSLVSAQSTRMLPMCLQFMRRLFEDFSELFNTFILLMLCYIDKLFKGTFLSIF